MASKETTRKARKAKRPAKPGEPKPVIVQLSAHIETVSGAG